MFYCLVSRKGKWFSFGKILPERGLRQGDPLSPYLFLLCAEGFSAILNKAEVDGLISGAKICPNAPSISHLLFADDSLILIRANEDATQLKRILELYEQCSGQMISKDKSAILFSKNTRALCRGKVEEVLGITKETMNEKYLGLPVYIGRDKSKTFAFLKDKVWQRIQGWKEITVKGGQGNND